MNPTDVSHGWIKLAQKSSLTGWW